VIRALKNINNYSVPIYKGDNNNSVKKVIENINAVPRLRVITVYP
jgi:hypothetical protein